MRDHRECSSPLKGVYGAFSVNPKPHTIDACPCCVDAAEVRTFLSTPLREITSDQLSSYASSVFLTAGSERDFRYFLPRILDIALNDRSWSPDREIVLGKLALAQWGGWSLSEIEKLHRLFEAAFEEAIQPQRWLASKMP